VVVNSGNEERLLGRCLSSVLALESGPSTYLPSMQLVRSKEGGRAGRRESRVLRRLSGFDWNTKHPLTPRVVEAEA
jgi:hypothetical protein